VMPRQLVDHCHWLFFISFKVASDLFSTYRTQHKRTLEAGRGVCFRYKSYVRTFRSVIMFELEIVKSLVMFVCRFFYLGVIYLTIINSRSLAKSTEISFFNRFLLNFRLLCFRLFYFWSLYYWLFCFRLFYFWSLYYWLYFFGLTLVTSCSLTQMFLFFF